MRKGSRLRGACLLLCAVFLCAGFPAHAEDEEIKVSEQEYAVTINDGLNLFLSNEKPVSGEIGSKVFLTYTVEEVTKNTSIQSGLIGCMDNTEAFPYDKGKGRMYVEGEENGSRLYEEGYTYVFRFERTENGFEYQAAKLKGDEAENIFFSGSTACPEEESYKYYGTWIGGLEGDVVSAILNHVRCYDEDGNDLGVTFNSPTASRTDEHNKVFGIHPVVKTSYSFSLDDTDTIAVSNRYPAKTDVIYMEYEVENVTQDDTYQQGLIVSSAPTETYPFSDNKGLLQVQIYEKGNTPTPLLKEGGKYFICFQKEEDNFKGTVQCTVDGETEMFSFTGQAGAYNPTHEYVSFWLGEGMDYGVTADFKNVKCYDAEGNSLGIQLNRPTVAVSSKGEIEDYSFSEAVYYCKDIDRMINLADKKSFTDKQEGITEEGTYVIQNKTELCLLTEEGKEVLKYEYLKLEDEEGNTYKRLKPLKVKFVTGEESFEVDVTAKTGFLVKEPEKPTKEGNTFKGWFLGDETAFNFDTVVSESITLYAMWEDGDGNTYLAVDAEDIKAGMPMEVAIAASAVIAAACVAGCIIIARRRRRGSI